MSPPFWVLVVDASHRCSGPLAEALLRHALMDLPGGQGIALASAGTHPRPGLNAAAVGEMTRLGATVPDAARPRQLDAALVAGSDLVLTCVPHQRPRVVELDPSAVRRVFTLTEFGHIAARCGWPGPGGDAASDLAGLTEHVAASRGLVTLSDAAAAGLVDPEGSRRRVRRTAREIAGLVDGLVRLLAGPRLVTGSGVRRVD